MPNPYGAPETDVFTLEEKIKADEKFILLDVREPQEIGYAQLDIHQAHLLPLSRLAREQINGLPDVVREKDTEIIVMCHHGIRSAQITAWLLHNGWENVLNLAGGIDAYAREIDPAIGRY